MTSLRRAGLVAAALLFAALVQGCAGTPRSAPLASELTTTADGKALEGLVAPLTLETVRAVNHPDVGGFPEAFLAADPVDPERLGRGDVLDVVVYEPGGEGLFTGEAARLEAVTIDSRGHVFIPFAGDLHAAGGDMARLRERVREALTPLTLGPEVDLRLREPNSRLTTVNGAVARPGVYPLARGATRLVSMLAAAGGADASVDRLEVLVRRGGIQGREPLRRVLRDPSADIALRPGDVVVVAPIAARFTAIGATAAQAEIQFPRPDLTLMSAIGAAAGLRDFDADPRSVFVVRLEDRETADALLPGPPPIEIAAATQRPIIYRADISDPGGLFAARSFRMRDGDTLIVANAPLTELRKLIQTFTAVLTPVQQSVTLTNP